MSLSYVRIWQRFGLVHLRRYHRDPYTGRQYMTYCIRIHSVPTSWALLKAQLINETSSLMRGKTKTRIKPSNYVDSGGKPRGHTSQEIEPWHVSYYQKKGASKSASISHHSKLSSNNPLHLSVHPLCQYVGFQLPLPLEHLGNNRKCLSVHQSGLWDTLATKPGSFHCVLCSEDNALLATTKE